MSILNPEPKPQSHKVAKSQSGPDNVNPRMIFFLKAAPWPKKFTRLRRAASLIEKETFEARFRNRPLLGFAIRNNSGKM
jgi:hypothetical protein